MAPARDVAFSTPEISNRTVEQVVEGLEDVDADILRHEQVLHRYQANIDLTTKTSRFMIICWWDLAGTTLRVPETYGAIRGDVSVKELVGLFL